jgi:subtilisin
MLPSRHRFLFGVILFLAVAILSPGRSGVSAQAPGDRVKVLIAFRSAPGAADEALVRGAGGQVRNRFHLVSAIAATLTPEAVAALRANPRVALVEPDVRIFAVDAELDNSWGVKRINAGTVHAGGNSGTGVKVGIIDTGIDYNHPELAANYAGGWDFVNTDADPFDDNKHGTHVAGTVAAVDNDLGVVGVAPQASLYALKVLDASGSGDFSAVIAALEWAVDHGLQVTNNSYGSTQDPGTLAQQAFDNAAAAGIVNVAAAGNSGNCAGTGDSVTWPARYDSVIAVAATDQNDVSPCFSSTGPKVELAAPGVNVNSTVPGGGFELLSGTSMASPHVAGAAALVIASGIADANSNGRINDEVRAALDNSAHDLGNAGRDTWYGFGLVDVAAAIAGPAPPEPAVNVTVTTNKTSYVSGVDTDAQLTATVRDETGTAIAGLAASAFVTMLDGVGTAVTFTETATPGTYTGSLNISGASTGSHTVSVTATDSRPLSGSGSASFTITVPNTVRVQSITYSTYGGFNGKAHLVITVKIVDGLNAPVPNGTVSIILYRNFAFYGSANGRSNAQGNAIFEARNAPAGCYQTLVAAVLAGTRSWDAVTPPNSFCK